jgi:DNA recombination protein RmuC
MLGLLGTFGVEWNKFNKQVDRVKKQFDTVAKGFDELAGPRRRQLERPLRELDALRHERHVPVDGQLFSLDTDTDTDDDDGETVVRQLGA